MDDVAFVPRLEREARLRLFQSLHQLPEFEIMAFQSMWHRASGRVLCGHCGLAYSYHPTVEEWGSGMYEKPEDVRLCDGRVVHL